MCIHHVSPCLHRYPWRILLFAHWILHVLDACTPIRETGFATFGFVMFIFNAFFKTTFPFSLVAYFNFHHPPYLVIMISLYLSTLPKVLWCYIQHPQIQVTLSIMHLLKDFPFSTIGFSLDFEDKWIMTSLSECIGYTPIFLKYCTFFHFHAYNLCIIHNVFDHLAMLNFNSTSMYTYIWLKKVPSSCKEAPKPLLSLVMCTMLTILVS